MKVIFTCGGTGGHINPAIAVAKMLQERKKDAQILFVGGDGMEQELVPREGFRLEQVKASSFQRKLTPAGIWHNMKAAVYVAQSLHKADRIIREFQPDVILGTGGYASFPMLRQGIKRKIPTAVHEANAVPGLTTRMVADGADRILVAFEDAKNQFAHPERVIPVGMPVREEFFYLTKADARRKLGLDERPLVVSAWGSLGAREMNKIMADFIALEYKNGLPFQHLHATGSYGWRWMPDYVKEKGVTLQPDRGVKMEEYIYDMPLWMAAADVILSRAGSSSLNEIAASGTPCVIVPSPNVTDNHQEKNARILEQRGAAVVVRESECSGELLYQTVQQLLDDAPQRKKMSQALRTLAIVDSTERIYRTIIDLAKQH